MCMKYIIYLLALYLNDICYNILVPIEPYKQCYIIFYTEQLSVNKK